MGPDMSHSLIGADGRTHCKIVAVALAGALVLVTAAVTARTPEPGIMTVLAPAHGGTMRAEISDMTVAIDGATIR
jgi:hypothetical protein